MSVSPQEFLEITELFTEVTPEKAEVLLEDEVGTSVFIGRETCPFCRAFIPKLYNVSQKHDVQIYFVHSEHPDYLNEIDNFRNKYNVPTVPGLLHSTQDGVRSKSDSSMSEVEIADFLNL